MAAVRAILNETNGVFMFVMDERYIYHVIYVLFMARCFIIVFL